MDVDFSSIMNRTLVILVIAIALLLCAVGIVAFPYINRYFSVSSIRFVVPDGYRGMFCIREQPNGIENTYSEDGRILYEIPKNGFLDVRDASPLQLTNSDICITHSGRSFSELPWPAQPPFDDRVGFSGLSVSSDGRYWFLIGTEQELYKYFNDGHDISIGSVKNEYVVKDRIAGTP